MTDDCDCDVPAWLFIGNQWQPVTVTAVAYTAHPSPTPAHGQQPAAPPHNNEATLHTSTGTVSELAAAITALTAAITDASNHPAGTQPRPPATGTAEHQQMFGAAPLSSGASKVLSTLAGFYPGSLTKKDLAQRASMKSSSHQFHQFLAALTSAGFVTVSDGKYSATRTGIAASNASEADGHEPPEQLLATARAGLKAGANRALDAVIAEHPDPIDRATLAEKAGVKPSSIRTYLSQMTTAGVIEVLDDGSVVLAAAVAPNT